MRTLVVAKYHEDTSWTDDLPDDWTAWIVEKDREVPNAGREASSWLWAMEQLWIDAQTEDQFVFVQGDPFPHEPDLFTKLEELDSISYVPIGNQHHIDDWTGFPHGGGLPIRDFWNRHIGGGDCPQYLPFVAGGQFAISGDNLCSRDRDWYSGLYGAACEEEKAPWILERLWGSIL